MDPKEKLLPDDQNLLNRLMNPNLQSSLLGRQSNPGAGQQAGGSNQNAGNNRGMNPFPVDIRDDVIRHLLRDLNVQPRPHNLNNNNRRSFQPIHKWPFTYSGEQNVMRLATFLKQVKSFADTEEMDGQALLRGVKHLLRGRALEWYTSNHERFGDWECRRLKPNFCHQIIHN